MSTGKLRKYETQNGTMDKKPCDSKGIKEKG